MRTGNVVYCVYFLLAPEDSLYFNPRPVSYPIPIGVKSGVIFSLLQDCVLMEIVPTSRQTDSVVVWSEAMHRAGGALWKMENGSEIRKHKWERDSCFTKAQREDGWLIVRLLQMGTRRIKTFQAWFDRS